LLQNEGLSPIKTRFRRIVTGIPVPASLPIIEKLRRFEPAAMLGQPPVVWDRAEGFQVWDAYGNQWIDWSSGVLVANAGHGRKEIVDAIVAQAQHGLLTNYCFPSEIRSRLAERLAGVLPEPLKKILLLTTGSETVEAVIKLCRMHGLRTGGPKKRIMVSFEHAFHGRTLGAQQAGGIPALKDWIGSQDPCFVQLPFPDGFRSENTSFESFERGLRERYVDPQSVAGIIVETYQGGSASFAPVDYMRRLREWCTAHETVLVLDEVQAGFGRCGTMWGFEHYGIVPDLACFGKGISSSLPLAAVAGRADVMDLPPQASMTSTHAGNPVCCAAALASLDLIVDEHLVENSRNMGNLLHRKLSELQQSTPAIGHVAGKGLVAGLACVIPGTKEPDRDLARSVVQRCIEEGVLMFSPVGFGGATVKISPPLVIHEAALLESVGVLEEVFRELTAS